MTIVEKTIKIDGNNLKIEEVASIVYKKKKVEIAPEQKEKIKELQENLILSHAAGARPITEV